MLLLSLIFPVLSFVLQAYPRFFNKYFGVDVWSRMLEADFIRRGHHQIPMEKIKNGFLLEGYFNYPPVFPWLLSFISKKTLFKRQGFIAPVFDSIQNFFIFIFVLQITGKIEIALLSQVIYATIPLIAIENSYLTPRSLGYLNLSLAFYPLILYSVNPNYLYLLIAFIFTVFIFFTHKFATQSLLFISIFFSVIEKNPLYIGNFLLALAFAILLSKGYYFRIYKGHIGNILFWFKNRDYRFAHQVRGLITKNKKTDFVGQIYNLMRLFSPVMLLATNPWMLFTFAYILDKLFNLSLFPQSILYYKLSLWVLFFYFFSILVLSFKFLIPIGEGHRYLEMATTPCAIVGSIVIYSLFNTIYRTPIIFIFSFLIIMNLALIIFLQWKGIIKDKNRSMTSDMILVFSFINKYKDPRILCIPHQITTMVLYNTKAKVLVDIESGTLQKISDVFPVLKKNVYEIAKKYNLNLLVLKKDYATMKELRIKNKDLLFDSGDTQVIAI